MMTSLETVCYVYPRPRYWRDSVHNVSGRWIVNHRNYAQVSRRGELREPGSRGSGETGDGVTGMNYNLEELAAKRDGSSGG